MVMITTARCRMRPMRQEDFSAICRYLQDAEVMRAWEHTLTDVEVRAWIARQEARYAVPGYGALALELRRTGEVIGQCGLTMQTCEGVELLPKAAEGVPFGLVGLDGAEEKGTASALRVPEVGYMLVRRHWGQGLATEAARACLRFGFCVLGLPEIFACIRQGNTASLAVARRLGMVVRGHFVKTYREKAMPHDLYAIRAEDFAAGSAQEDAEYAVDWRC